MRRLLHNMSAPPKTQIIKKVQQLGDYLCFNPENLAKQLNCSVNDLPKTIKEYVGNNSNWQEKIKKPSSYMIATIPQNKKNNFSANICDDISLQLYIFGKIVGDMYIPNRRLSWTKDVFIRDYYFLKNEVLE